MTLTKSLVTKEQQKFVEYGGETAVRINGDIVSSSPKTSGLMTEVTVNATGWTLLPTSGLSNRRALSIQNQSSVAVKYNYTNSVGYVGKIIQADGDANIDITDDIALYGRSASSTALLLIEEIA